MTASGGSGAIASFLAAHGFNTIAIDGILGNLQVESGFNPQAYNANEGAIGIAQWEGGRRTALQDYARSTGSDETNLTTQLNFLLQEVQQRGLLNELNNAGSPAEAATIWDTKFEVSAGTTRAQRIANANAFAKNGTGSAGPNAVHVGGFQGPYPVDSLKPPLGDAKRNTIIDFMAKHQPPHSLTYAADVRGLQKLNDADLIAAYKRFVAGYVVQGGDPGAVTPGVGPLPNPLSGIQDVYKLVIKVLQYMTDVQNWERIGLFVAGAIILLVAAVKLFSNVTGVNPVSTAAKAAMA